MNTPRSYITLSAFLTVFCLIPGSGGLLGQTLIATVAGISGSPGYSGDGQAATNARLHDPVGLCFDASDNMYIADCLNNCIRRVDAITGLISTIAGTGVAGFSGDGGLAVNAQLNHPTKIISDKGSRLFFVDYSNLRVRMIDLGTGVITTVAGNGTEIYVNGEIAITGGMTPSAITLDMTGNLVIAQDYGPLVYFPDNIISKLNLTTGRITTIAGNGTYGFSGDGGPAINAQFSDPQGLCYDAAGNLYIADYLNTRVRRIDAVTGIIITIAGNGGTHYNSIDGTPALFASFKSLTDVLIDGNGNLILVDQSGERVSQMDMKTGILMAIAGTGYVGDGPDCVSPTSEVMDDCTAVAIGPAGNIYFSETAGHRIREVFPASSLSSVTISSPSPAVCVGSPTTLTFKNNPANGVGPFSYQWMVNGQNAGNNAPTFTDFLHNGDVVTCQMSTTTPGGPCFVIGSATSNSFIAQVLPFVTPTVLLFTPTTLLCTGSSADFIATAFYAGPHPGFQWTLNGNPVGDNSDAYSATGLMNNDVVQCLMTIDPSTQCTTTASALATPITMKVGPGADPGIQVNASADPICEGDSVLFTATVENEGAAPDYQWTLNGVNVGPDLNVYTNKKPQNNDVVNCLLTVHDGACAGLPPVLSNAVTVSVNPNPVIDLPTEDTIVSPGRQLTLQASVTGNLNSWQWTPAGDLTNPSSLNPLTTPMASSTTFLLSVLSAEGCRASGKILVRVFIPLAMPNSFTPNGDGKNDIFRIPGSVAMQLKEFDVFDRWGNKVFSTNNVGQGWDGKRNGITCPTGTYVWLVSGSDQKGKVFAKGTVILLR